MKNVPYFIVGMLLGVVFVKAEIISWYRIHEMFRFESFHMYGVIGSAVITGMICLQCFRIFKVKSLNGQPIHLEPKKFHKGFIYGSFLFGIGWALTGACPGPLYAQIGAGYTVVSIGLLSALLGTWVYGKFLDKLPH